MGFMSKNISYDYMFPTSRTQWTGDTHGGILTHQNLLISSGNELQGDFYSLDVNDTQLRFDFAGTALWSFSKFNGPIFTDTRDVLNPIIGVSVGTNVAGFDRRDVTFSQNSISVNLQGLATDDYSYITITVRFGPNPINGTAGNDSLHGTLDNDAITGGKGVDTLKGGGGSDIFIFAKGDTGNTNATADTITDFIAADDKIDLSKWDANSLKGGVQHFDFIGNAAFDGHAGELRVVTASSDTYIYGDTNGDRRADFIIHLDDAVRLTVGNFHI